MPLEHVEAANTVLLYLDIESYLKDLPKLGLPIVLTGGSWGASRPIPAMTSSVAFGRHGGLPSLEATSLSMLAGAAV